LGSFENPQEGVKRGVNMAEVEKKEVEKKEKRNSMISRNLQPVKPPS
jgi:hypothetical protein